MAKDRKKLQHIHSSIPDKQPTPASLEVGEIAVNNAKEQEFLSIKNSNDKVVRFSSDGQIISWIERKEVMPYKGYVRGDGGPAVTSGDTPTPDAKGSYGISNDDLLNNKSELVFKLNQVAADLTTKHDKVNGAKDMYNEEINPTDDYGVNDGAGFFIDMSRYAMRDGNPSFSALTATCQTTLSGNTYIRDGASANTYGTDTGHTLDIKVTNNIVSGVTWDEILNAKTESISGRTTTIGNDGENLHVIGTTTEVHDDDVTITNKSNVAENTSGTSTINIVEDNIVNVSGETHITTTGNTAIHTESKLGLTAKGDIMAVSSENDIFITANKDICETAGVNASFYAVEKTNIGLDCSDAVSSITTNIYGETMNVDASTANTVIGTADTKITSATTLIGTNTITISGNTVENTSGTTTIDREGDVSENNQSDVTVVTSGNHRVYVTGDTCINSQSDANFYGKESTNIGVACDGTKGSATTVYGSTTINISGGTITETSTANTIVNVGGNLSETISGTTTIKTEDGTTIQTTAGDTNINTSGSTNITATDGICAVADNTAAFVGTVKTNIGRNCSDGGQTATLNINGDTINETGNTVNISATTNVNVSASTICESASTAADFYGPTTNIGISCGNSTATTVNISGTTINEGGTNLNQNVTNYDLNGSVICISGSTNSNFYGVTTNIGVDCGGTTATTVNVSGATINEGGTTNNNNFTTVNNTATTINNNTNTYNITGATNIDGNTIIDGTLNVSGVTTIGDTLILKEGLEKTLSWEYGSVCNEPTSATSTNFKDNAKFIIPKTLSDVSCGVVDLTSGCLNINKNICVTGKIEVSNGVYNTSDERLKENIKRVSFEQMLAARNVGIKQFTYKNDEDKKLTYGVTAQDVAERRLSEIIHFNEEGYMSVDYTSLMILKIAYLENEVERLTDKLEKTLEKLDSK